MLYRKSEFSLIDFSIELMYSACKKYLPPWCLTPFIAFMNGIMVNKQKNYKTKTNLLMLKWILISDYLSDCMSIHLLQVGV